MTRGAALDLRGDDLLTMTPAGVLEAHVRAHPDAVYLTSEGREFTFGELWELSGRVATGLARKGIRRGDRITTWLPTGTDWIVCALALGRLGVLNVLTNSRFRSGEVAELVTRSGCRGLITTQQPDAGFDVTSDIFEWTVTTDGAEWATLTSTAPDDAAVAEAGAGVNAQDPLYVMFTSGTTGRSKGSMTRGGPALKNAWNSGERMGFTDDDRLLCFLPMSHTFGAVNAFLNTLTHGSRLDLEAEFEAKGVLDLVAQRGITALFGVPTHYMALVSAWEDGGRSHDLTTWTKGCIAGGTISPELRDTLEFDLQITGLSHAYGMTESTALISQARWDDPIDIRIGTTGKAMPDVEMRLEHGETGEEVGPGEPGNILIRGFNLHAGYLGMERDPSLRDDGWWETGDIGSCDAAGNLQILGRSKDMYKTSGFNVYPAEVEAFLVRHPSISEAAVVGVPHHRKSETGVAFLIASPDATIDPDEIKRFARAEIAGYKVPDHIFVVDDFPRSSATLKIQKHELRAQAIETLGDL